MFKTISIILGLLLSIFVFYFYWQRLVQNDLPSGKTTTQTIVVENGQVLKEPIMLESNSQTNDIKKQEETVIVETTIATKDKVEPIVKKVIKEIFVTDGVKHSVPLDEILGGGPTKDGIPSIDKPKYISVKDASDFLNNEEPGIGVSINGIDRFYPFQILVWHEIVNDEFNGKKVLVTYCPLCLSGIVFDPLVKGEYVEFGTSGKLWQSNLVMYDRKTDSYWSQILGEAILGEMTGTKLGLLPSDRLNFGEWKKEFPDGAVLSKDTGAKKFYGTDPYGDYYTTPGTFFPVRAKDDRLTEKDVVLGIVINNMGKAYLPEAIKQKGEVIDTFQGKTFVLRYIKALDTVRIFEKLPSGGEDRINPFPSFWFSWVAAYPETQLFK
jgi:uncharacterized protein (UPF0128 family)